MNTIKRHIKSVLLIAACWLAVACTDENTFGTQFEPALSGHYLHLSSSSVSLAAAAHSSEQIEVGCVGTSWQFAGMEPWLSVSPATGSTDSQVVLTAAENTSGSDARTTVFDFRSTDAAFSYSRQVSVTQQAATPYVRPSATALTFAAAGGTQTVTLEANIGITLTNSATGWLSAQLSADERTLMLTAAENTTQQERPATISLGAGTTISIVQAKASTPVASPGELLFPNTGGAYQLTISSEVSWTASTSQSWLDVSPQAGSGGTAALTVEATPNTGTADRAGFVYISIGSQQVLSISVRQRGIYIDVEPDDVSFGVDGGEETLSIESNTAWQVVSKPGWIDVAPSEGSGDGTLKLTATANTGDSRTGSLLLGLQGSTTALATVTLSQQGRYFELTPTTVSVAMPSTGGTHQVHISTNSPWQAASSSAWMQLSQRSGQGSQDVDVTLTTPDHPSVSSREDRTTFTPTYGTAVTIVTTQAGRYLRADAAELTFFAKGGTSEAVTVTTDATYTVTSSDTSWLTISQQGNTFTATAAENTTGADREAAVVIAMTNLTADEEFELRLPVRQYYHSPGIVITPFGSDEQWDIVTGTGAVISVTGFGSDENWN